MCPGHHGGSTGNLAALPVPHPAPWRGGGGSLGWAPGRAPACGRRCCRGSVFKTSPTHQPGDQAGSWEGAGRGTWPGSAAPGRSADGARLPGLQTCPGPRWAVGGTKVGPWARGACPPTWGRQQQQQQQRRRERARGRGALHGAGGGRTKARGAGRGSWAGARRGDGAGSTLRRSLGSQRGARRRRSIIPPRGGRGEGAAGRGLGGRTPPTGGPGDARGPCSRPPAPRGARGPRLGVGARTPNLSLVGPEGGTHSGGRRPQPRAP